MSTLHTNNSLTTIERLIDMDVERYLLSSSLKGIISQTLAKRLCPKCRIVRPANETEKTLFKKVLGIDINTIYEAGRCEHCHNGYTGRIALQEVLMINDEIKDAINNNVKREQLRNLIYKKDVKTLLQDGLIKVLQGITDLKEVLRLVDYDEYDDISERIVQENVKEKQSIETSPLKRSFPKRQNRIIEPLQNNEEEINLFDDNIFNSLRVNSFEEQEQ